MTLRLNAGQDLWLYYLLYAASCGGLALGTSFHSNANGDIPRLKRVTT